MKRGPHILYSRGVQQKVWIEVYFDPERDGRWHVTQWQYSGRFDPMTARHKTLDESYAGIREARDAGTMLRQRWLSRRDAASYRRYMPQDVKVTVTPKCEDLARAVLAKDEGEEVGHVAQGVHEVDEQQSPLGRTASTGVRYDGRRGD